MIYLDVPFAQKDQAKSLGARWDGAAKKWYIPDHLEAEKDNFALWLPNVAPVTPDTANATMSMDFSTHLSGIESQQTEKPKTSLSQYLSMVQQAIQFNVLPNQWIVAELSNLQRRGGHLYLELSENSESGHTLASCRGMIWASNVMSIEQKFSQVTAQALQSGQKLLLNVSASFHPQYGFSLQVNDIDPSFTLGEIEKVLAAIRDDLKKRGLWQQNKQQVLAKDFYCVAVIAPDSAAGLGDFQAEADRLAEAGICQFDYFTATFQGDKVLPTFEKAFKQLMPKISQYQALIIIRGGGAKLDLHQLNKLEIAEQICQCTIPVLTGIGHERDNTILDEVAHTRFDTPSKVIGFIESSILQITSAAKQNWQMIQRISQEAVLQQKHQISQRQQFIQQTARQFVLQQKQKIESYQQNIIPFVMHQLQRERLKIDASIQQVQSQANRTFALEKNKLENYQKQLQTLAAQGLRTEKERIESFMRLVLSSGKETQLSRGFAIVRQAEQTMTHAKGLDSKQPLQIEMQDAFVTATEFTIQEKEK